MVDEEGPSDELRGWKEIAEFLRVSVNTAKNYEKSFGLPIHRRDGSEKSPVWGRRTELKAWDRERDLDPSSTAQDFEQPITISPVPLVPGARRNPKLWLPVASLAMAAVAIFWWYTVGRKGPPDGFALDGSDLVIKDRTGLELWRYTFPQHFHTYFYQPTINRPQSAWFGDLDRDGQVEVLFPYFPQKMFEGAERSEVFCFSQSGKLKWKFTPGRIVHSKDQSFSDVYYLNVMKVVKMPDGQYRVVLSSVHSFGYPDQVVLLNPAGQIVGEYWHSGHLLHMATADLDKDGVEEILLTGVNDAYAQATLVVLDPRRVDGASSSPNGSVRQIQGFGRGTEKAVVLFPRSLLNQALYPRNRAEAMRVQDGRIEVRISETHEENGVPYVINQLDYNLNCIGVMMSSDYVRSYRDELLSGRLKQPYDETAEVERLRKITVIK